jgi:hypothetical protein
MLSSQSSLAAMRDSFDECSMIWHNAGSTAHWSHVGKLDDGFHQQQP